MQLNEVTDQPEVVKNPHCDCPGPGWCPRYKREMAGRLLSMCRGENISKAEAALYRQLWLDQAAEQPNGTSPVQPSRLIDCPHAGNLLTLPDGSAKLKECASCGGNVRMKVFACNHPQTAPEVTLADCRDCPYRPDLQPPQVQTTKSILLKFPHGLGDAVALTAVLAHLRKYHPDWQIDVQSDASYAPLFASLIHGFIAHDGAMPAESYAETFDLKWEEGFGSHSRLAATKAVRCLKEVFQIEPEEELLCWDFNVDQYAVDAAQCVLNSLPKNKGVVALHFQGKAWGGDQKDIPVGVARAYCKWLRRRGYTPLVLHYGEPQRYGKPLRWIDNKKVFMCAEHNPAILAALLAQTRLNVMIDSGPQKLALVTNTPLLAVWVQANPYNFLDNPRQPAEQLHLIPADYRTYLLNSYGVDRVCDETVVMEWLNTRCTHFVYSDLFSGLCTGTTALLGETSAPATQAATVVKHEPRKLLLHCGLPPGDVMTLTAAIETLHKLYPGKYLTAVSTNCQEIWENNPHVVSSDSSFERVDMHYHLVNESGHRPVHFIEGYTEFLADYLGIEMRACVNRPYIYLSQQEKDWMNQCWEVTKNNSPYWVINAGVKSDYTAKQYGSYQEVVDLLQGKVRFVQVGLDSDMHIQLRGVVNLIGKTSLRALLRLVYHAQGVVTGVSLLMHIAASFDRPGVVVAGGREPRLWNSYATLLVLNNVGSLDCCATGACWKGRVIPLGDGRDGECCRYPLPTTPPSPRCMGLISPTLVAESVKSFLP